MLALARDACTGLPLPEPAEVPPWLEGFPVMIENAKPVDLARVDARARAAALRAMGGS